MAPSRGPRNPTSTTDREVTNANWERAVSAGRSAAATATK